MVEHDDDDAIRLEPPEQGAAVDRLGPGGVGLEEDVARSEGIEIEIGAGVGFDVGEAVGGADQLRPGKGEITSGVGVEGDQPRRRRRVCGELVAQRAHHALNAGSKAPAERIADIDIEHPGLGP